MAIDSCARANGPDLRKCRPKAQKAAGPPVSKKPLIPRSLAMQPAAAAAAPRASPVRPADLSVVFVEAVACNGVADAHVVAQEA